MHDIYDAGDFLLHLLGNIPQTVVISTLHTIQVREVNVMDPVVYKYLVLTCWDAAREYSLILGAGRAIILSHVRAVSVDIDLENMIAHGPMHSEHSMFARARRRRPPGATTRSSWTSSASRMPSSP